MANEASANKIDKAKIYETILCSPGMHESRKIVLNPTRQTILALARLIENELKKNDEQQGMK